MYVNLDLLHGMAANINMQHLIIYVYNKEGEVTYE